MPREIVPMKATLVDRPPRGADWLFEVKWDGVRAICYLDKETVRLVSRTGLPFQRQYPELATLHHFVAARQAILDGEIAVLDSKGVSRFELIQPRIANTDPNSVAHLSRSTPAVYFVFDLLYLDGYDLRQVALRQRKEILRSLLGESPVLRYSEDFPGAGDEMLAAAEENGLEGVIAKHANSCYESRRSREWLKIKIVGEQEFVISGYTEPRGERDCFGALVLGAHESGKLVWVGNVGTGFNRTSIEQLFRRMQPLVQSKSPFARRENPGHGITWVKPELVCQVKFANWTRDNKLRAPVFLGLREDVNPREVVRERAGRSAGQAGRSG